MVAQTKKAAQHAKGGAPAQSRIDVGSLKESIGDDWLSVLRDLAPELEEACNEFPEHVPCPIHGGKDGFRLFNDAEETGGGICNTCGAFPDGIALLRAVKGWTFIQACKNIESWLDALGDEDEPESEMARS